MTTFLEKNLTGEIDTREIPTDRDANTNLVEVRKLNITRNKVLLLEDISFNIKTGEFVGLIGKNGVGKTTLLQAFIDGDHRKIYQGDIEIAKIKFPAKSIRESAKLVAYVPQLPHIPKQMLVCDYVMLGRLPYQNYLGNMSIADLEITKEVLAQLDLANFSNRVLGELSGGELQRVIIARALVQKAPFLVLDEPATSLDIYHQLMLLELLKDLCKSQEMTIFCSLHDINLAAQYCDRIIMLGQNKVLADNIPSQVLTRENIKEAFSVDSQLHTVKDNLVVIPRLFTNPYSDQFRGRK